MNKQLKILQNKKSQIEKSILELQSRLTERITTLCRNDPGYQALFSKLEMEKIRLNDMSDFLQMLENKTPKKKKDEEKKGSE